MAAATPLTSIDPAAVVAASRARGEPEWLIADRLEAIGALSSGSADDSEDRLPEAWGDLTGLPGKPDLWPKPSGSNDGRGDQLPPDTGSEAEAAFGHQLATLRGQGVIFCSMDVAVRDHGDLVEPYLGTVIGQEHGTAGFLNRALWSGGTFLHVPPGVAVAAPLQAFNRLSGRHGGRFPRSLIVAMEGASVHYVNGCPAPVYTTEPLHVPAIEVVVGPRAEVTCTTVQNWSANVINVTVTAATVDAGGSMRWLDAQIGSAVTDHRPVLRLVGVGAIGEAIAVAAAGAGQHQSIGAKVHHGAPMTESRMVMKALAGDGGLVTHHRHVMVTDDATGCSTTTTSDGLLVDDRSAVAAGEPTVVTSGGNAEIDVEHAERLARPSPEAVFHLQTRGLVPSQALAALACRFTDPVTSQLPTEYAVEWDRLIEMAIGGSYG